MKNNILKLLSIVFLFTSCGSFKLSTINHPPIALHSIEYSMFSNPHIPLYLNNWKYNFNNITNIHRPLWVDFTYNHYWASLGLYNTLYYRYPFNRFNQNYKRKVYVLNRNRNRNINLPSRRVSNNRINIINRRASNFKIGPQNKKTQRGTNTFLKPPSNSRVINKTQLSTKKSLNRQFKRKN